MDAVTSLYLRNTSEVPWFGPIDIILGINGKSQKVLSYILTYIALTINWELQLVLE